MKRILRTMEDTLSAIRSVLQTTSKARHDWTEEIKYVVRNLIGIDTADPVIPPEIEPERLAIIGPLGSGEFGLVYKATLESKITGSIETTSFPVAVKITKIKGLSPEVYITKNKELLLEAALLAQFNHPNILKLVGVVTITEKYFIVLSYCEFGTLLDYLKNQSERSIVTFSSRMDILNDVSMGLEYLHDLSVIHGDIACRNILVNSNNRYQISDFGLSRMVGQQYKLPDGYKIPFRWSAPEFFAISSQEINCYSLASDMW